MKSTFLSFFITSLIFFPFSVFAVSITTQNLPQAGMISPKTAIREKSVTYSAQVKDNDILKSCDLMVDQKSVGAMTIKTDVVYKTHKISMDGSYKLFIKCKDTDGNEVSGKEVIVTVSAGSKHTAPADLIKAACPSVVYPNHPCSAVYYYGVDGKRHAFPNERVYKSWYKNFDKIVVLSTSAMAEIPLGKNVIFRPDNRLIKFSNNTVYAISFAGLLRPISSSEIAEVIYGKEWVSVIETVDDVFFGNYRIGLMIEGSKDFAWNTAKGETNTIDETF